MRGYITEKDIEQKPANELISGYLRILNIKSNDDPSLQNTKTECLKKFLNRVKVNFSFSKNTRITKLLDNHSKTQYENELINNCKSLCIALMSCLIQADSNAITLLATKLIIYLSHLNEFHEQFRTLNIDTYIIRLIDLDTSLDETILAIEYIRLISQLYPNFLSESHFYCLISSVEDSEYRLNPLIIETLLELTCKRPKLACKCQVFSYFINYVVNVCNENEFCINIVIQTFLKCLDRPECRELIRFDDLFSILIAPFVDFDYVPLVFDYSSHKNNPSYYSHYNQKQHRGLLGSESSNEPRIESIIAACSSALQVILNSYIGIMCFSTGDSYLIKNLLTPFSWFMNNNLNLNKTADTKIIGNLIFSFHVEQSQNTKLTKQQQIIIRQMTILNCLVDFLYKLFRVKNVSARNLINKTLNSHSSEANDVNSRSSMNSVLSFSNIEATDVLEDEFVNSECNDIFVATENLISQSNVFDLIGDRQNSISSGPNLTMCFKAYLLILFVEAGLFEALLDLYFGIPISFLDNNTDTIRKNLKQNNILSQYQNLSYKVLNLFAELFYMTTTSLSTEYSIDSFNEMTGTNMNTKDSDELKRFYNQGIYSDLKRAALVVYLKKLDDEVREREVITYLTEFFMKQENIKNGSDLPIETICKLSFFSQQFLINSGFISSSKYHAELEILQLEKVKTSVIIEPKDLTKSESKEFKKYISEIEKSFHAQIDATSVLQVNSNIANYDPYYTQTNTANSNHYNWYEVIKLFEMFLLTESTIHTRFSPTHEALFLNTNFYLLTGDSKFLKFIKKLISFFTPNIKPNERYYPNSDTPLETSNRLARAGCYLIDFLLKNLDMNRLKQGTSNASNTLEYNLVEFIQGIKLHLSYEFFKSSSGESSPYKRSSSNNSILSSHILTKDSVVSYYILFIGHLTSTFNGDKLLDSFKIYDIMQRIVEQPNNLLAMKLIASTFNFYTSIKARKLLEKCLICNFKQIDDLDEEARTAIAEFQVYILKLIFNLFRSNNLKFNVFFIDILINSIAFNDLFTQRQNKQHNLSDLNDQYTLELTINLIEYLVNIRPDLIDSYFQLNIFNKDKIQKLMRQITDRGFKLNIQNSRVILIKLRLMLYRFTSSKHLIEELTLPEMENLVTQWNALKLDAKYYQLIERNLFDSYAINSSFMDEFDERISMRVDLDVSESKAEEENSRKKLSEASNFIKLYRRINEPKKNNSIYSAARAQVYVPFHINSALIRFTKFKKNGFFLNQAFEQKMLEYLRVIKENSIQVFYSQGVNRINPETINQMKLRTLKSALWAICCLCNCENGFEYISLLNRKIKQFINLFEFVACIIKLAESFPVLSVRSTGFFCLNYISKTRTGTDLLGQLGWHTFQPNFAVQNKAFYTALNTFTNEQLDLRNFYSVLDVSSMFYNLNRSKVKLEMKKIRTEKNLSQLSSQELEFLDTQNCIDLLEKDDFYFFKSEKNLIQIGFFHENVTAPMQVYLMSPRINYEANLDNFETNTPELIAYSDHCNVNSCLSCLLNLKINGKVQTEEFIDETDPSEKKDPIKRQIINLIEQYSIITQLFYLEKTRNTLIKLKINHPDKFDLCLHNLVTSKVLNTRKVKFHFRKFIQQLFFDLPLAILYNSDLI